MTEDLPRDDREDKSDGSDERAAKPNDGCVTRGDVAPLFQAEAYLNGDAKQIRLSDHKGDWVVLFFYSSDFTFV
ncbi:redoxin domain-containing protein [Alicyclobacillus mengziensis]|uniref:Redoxin domain-containing protein n=2 Tax=Alicyclobacillus mengziensis TaxID=2931921 RepID=A0A9X7Z826_9BACL|nr:redoxin domain-containing protein [Alicyclobacillus mengziensis]